MTTVASLLAECRNDYLMTGAREARNTLSVAVTDTTSTTYAFSLDMAGIARGTRISVDLEDSYVYGVSSSAAIVSRGDFGSTAATHSTGAVVTVNPRFSDAQILRAFNHELQRLSAPALGVYQMKSVDVTFNAAISGYDLTSVTNVLDIYKLAYKDTGSARDWPVIPRAGWQYLPNLSTSEFASGKAIFIREGGWPGNPIRVWYKAPFTASLAATTDDVLSVTGLHTEAHDILALGAAIRLSAGREVRRNFDESQGDTRRASEVPAGANLGANRGLQQQFQLRVREEASRLQLMYPPVVR